MPSTERVLVLGLLLLAACGPEKLKDIASPPQAVVGVQVPRESFGQLRWIEGTWRGAEDGGRPFYERYKFVDDSTLLAIAFTDSLLDAATADSSVVIWRNGTVSSHNGAAYALVTQFDSTSVHFDPVEGIANSFKWSRVSADAWEAILESKNSKGEVKTVVYHIERYGKKDGR